MNKSLKEFWTEICLPENKDIRVNIFSIDYLSTEKDPFGDDNRFTQIQEELLEINEGLFTDKKEFWKYQYVATNTNWLFITAGDVFGIVFDNIMVMHDTELSIYYLDVNLWNYPFKKDNYKSWNELIEDNKSWCYNYENLLNRYLYICQKYGFKISLNNQDGALYSEKDFEDLLYKDFKGE